MKAVHLAYLFAGKLK